MVNLKRVEDRPTPKEIYNTKTWCLAAIAAFGACMIGYDSAFVGGSIVLPSFIATFGKLADETKANIVSTYQAGAFFGALFGYPLGHYAGRKWGIFACATIFTIGSIIMTVASESTGLAPIYAGRVIAGLAIGAASNLCPIFISEIAPPAIRGQLVGLWEAGWQSGGIIGFWINYGVAQNIPVSDKQWRIPFGVQLIPGGLLMIGSLFLVESPRWLMSRGRDAEAVTNLAKIRNLDTNHTYLQEELSDMRSALDKEMAVTGTTFWGPFKATFCKGKILYRLFLASALFAFQSGTGIQAINYYSPTVFKSLGITGTNTGLLTTGIFGVIKTVGAVVWILFLIDHFGRRKIFMAGAAGGAAFMIWIGAYILKAKPALRPAGSGLDSAGTGALVAFYLWTACYGPTWNGTPWVWGSEVFPQASRTVAQAFVAASNWLWTFVLARSTPAMFTSMGGGVYLFYAGMMMLSIPFVFFFIPETKGVPLDHMDELFDAPVPTWRAGPYIINELQNRNLDAPHLRSDGQTNGSSSPEKRDLDLETASAGSK